MGNCIPSKKKKGKEDEVPTDGSNEAGSLDEDAVSVGYLSVTVIRAKLETGKTPSKYDPYVKVEVTGGASVTRRETVRRENTSNPIWGHRLEGIPVGKADLLAVRLFVHSDEKHVKNNPFLGYAEVALPVNELVELLVAKRNLSLTLTGRPGNVQDQAFMRQHNDKLGELVISLRTCLPDLVPGRGSTDVSNALSMIGLDDQQLQYQSIDVMVAGASLKPEYHDKYTIELSAQEGVAHGSSLPRQTDPKQGPQLSWKDGGEPVFSWLLHSIGVPQQLTLSASVFKRKDPGPGDADASMVLQEELLTVISKLTSEDFFKALARPLKKKLLLSQPLAPEPMEAVEQPKTDKEDDADQLQQLFLIFRSSLIIPSQPEDYSEPPNEVEKEDTTAAVPYGPALPTDEDLQMQRTERINTLIDEIESNIEATQTEAKVQEQLSNFFGSMGDKNATQSASLLLKKSHDLEDVLYNQLSERYPNRVDDLDFLKQFYMIKQGLLKAPDKKVVDKGLPHGHGPLDPSLIADDVDLSTEERLRRAMLREHQKGEILVVPSRKQSLGELFTGTGDVVHRDPNFVTCADEMVILPPPPPNPVKTLPSIPNEVDDAFTPAGHHTSDDDFHLVTRSEESRISALEKEIRYMQRTVQKTTDISKRFDEYSPAVREGVSYESRNGFLYHVGKQTPGDAVSPASTISIPPGPVPRQRSEMLSVGISGHCRDLPRHTVSEYELHSWMSVMPSAGIEVVAPNRLSPKPKRWRKGAPISPTNNPTGWRPMSPAKVSSSKRPWK
eukprot:TRINITY_DN19200_c0_g1_i1.p1 TRINITY_DN19200_c0_g1~~TRINITY_DN19200_c0_g1_i1.p1  ORF type:complete len:782 (+),score=168.78 TRINITY_DN19200_c0_g1_i1:65-2410(+)